MSNAIEIGQVNHWHYFIRPVVGGHAFEIVRRDYPEDRLEEVLDEAQSEEEARVIAQAEIKRRRRELKIRGTKVQEEQVPKRLLNVTDAAGYLAVSPSTLYGWAWQRKIPFVKVGRSLRFDLADLEKFVDSNRAEPAGRFLSK